MYRSRYIAPYERHSPRVVNQIGHFPLSTQFSNELLEFRSARRVFLAVSVSGRVVAKAREPHYVIAVTVRRVGNRGSCRGGLDPC